MRLATYIAPPLAALALVCAAGSINPAAAQSPAPEASMAAPAPSTAAPAAPAPVTAPPESQKQIDLNGCAGRAQSDRQRQYEAFSR